MATPLSQKASRDRSLSACDQDQNKRRKKDPLLAFWLERVLQWFPDLHSKTYFVPPVHFCRENVTMETVAGHPVVVRRPVLGLLPTSCPSPGGCAANGCNGSQPSLAPTPLQPSLAPTPLQPSLAPTPLQPSSAPPAAPGLICSPHNGGCLPAKAKPTLNPGRKQPHVDHTACCLWASLKIVSGKPMEVGDGFVRDDRAQQHVLHCLRSLADGKNDVMMVLSEMKYENYLKKLREKKSAKISKSSKFGKSGKASEVDESEETYPTSYSSPDPHLQRGDFDILVIHREFGLLVGEIKSTGDNLEALQLGGERALGILSKKIAQVVAQLCKAELVLGHLLRGLPGVRVSKTIFLPNVTRHQMMEAVGTSPGLEEQLRDCVGGKNCAEAVSLCLCADQLSPSASPWQVTPEVLQNLNDWWERRVTSEGPDQNMSDTLYENLVARFCGPATTVEVHCVLTPRVEVRTEGEAVSETGERMARLTLTPQQVDLLSRAPPLVYVTGPPGTGKTVALVVMGLRWLRAGHDVHVVSTWKESRAMSFLIEKQLNQTLAAEAVEVKAAPRVHRHEFDLVERDTAESAAGRLAAHATEDGRLYVLADEAGPDLSQKYQGRPFSDLCERLAATVPALHLWAAAMRHGHIPRHVLHQETLTVPLRCPPAVVREVELAEEISMGDVLPYDTSLPLTVPTDGLRVKILPHKDHRGIMPQFCEDCGRAAADVLLNELHVGRGAMQTSREEPKGPPPLRFRDVLVLCPHPHRDTGFVKGLRALGVPVAVVPEKPGEDEVRSLALAERDEVTVSHWTNVHGLERKVVVGLAPNTGVYHRLQQMSRCTAQLIWFDLLASSPD